jgi:hypothetical protein
MKILIVVHLLIVLFYGCGLIERKDEGREFLPGTYTRFSQHEFGTEHDTLVISLQNKAAGEYKIVRRWKYERLLDGKAIEPEYKFITTSGIYHSSKKLLEERETGDFFSFDVTGELLFNGPVKYQKL